MFPDSALYMYDMGSPSKMKNILVTNQSNFSNGSFIVSAIVPCDSSLRIKFTKYTGTGGFTIHQPYYGWKLTNLSSGFDLIAQRKNFTNGLVLFLNGSADSAKVEYFQNNSSVPYFTKTIHW
jgi:hypothetical protein